MKIPLDPHLETAIKNFPDALDIYEDSGERFINAFSYAAPPDYSKYGYLPIQALTNIAKSLNKAYLMPATMLAFWPAWV